ncbi:F-box/WD repeat-containing protein 8-like isoform X2 [Corticium candelabrum]|uniref:F-box/WD repeat-containing protein 8-like isoform X2 n=1 Tax=Corticium candelabrum TaxID=121492 RepID=UPI002E26CAAE|nr:F-box/WD repeat-containing protein 8-like isoform X2 [Corticium candelabrum]
MKQQRDKLQSELEEFRQHWFASLAHVRPPVECSSEPSIPVTVDCKTSSYTASCSYRKHSCEARPRGGDEMKSREVVKVDIEEVRASSEANKLEQDSKCKQSGGRNSQFEGSHHMTTHTKMSLNNTHKRKIFCQRSMTKRHRRESIEENLVDQLISDINEITDVPFFDVKLPKEVGIRVFSFLDFRDLCRCSQVSWSWHILADDEVLWYRVCQGQQFKNVQNLSIASRVGWKGVARHHHVKAQLLKQNWRERRCHTQELQYPRCRVLSCVNASCTQVIAGYDSGDVCVWDVTDAMDNGRVLSPSVEMLEGYNRVTCTTVNNSAAACSYLNGDVCVWNSSSGEKQHTVTLPGSAKCMRMSSDGCCLAVATNNTFQSYQLCHIHQFNSDTDELLWLCKDGFQILSNSAIFSANSMIKKLSFVSACLDQYRVVIATDREVYLHTVGCSPDRMLMFEGGEARQIRLTCSDTTSDFLACGVSGYGFDALCEGCRVRVHSLCTGQFLCSLSGHWSDVLCVDIANAPKNMIVSGSADKSVRVFDMRIGSSAFVLKGHTSYVSHVQMDDWKVVSGTNDGTVYVWDQRMQRPLWDTHSRHPVHLCCFDETRLITANVPLVDSRVYHDTDDGIFHRRLTGSIHVFDFSVSELDTQDLPSVCYSNYDEPSASSYRVGLAVPYDEI